MFLDDVDHLALAQVDLMGVLPTVVSQDTVLLQVLHLVRVGDDSLSSCGRGEGEYELRQNQRRGERERIVVGKVRQKYTNIFLKAYRNGVHIEK